MVSTSVVVAASVFVCLLAWTIKKSCSTSSISTIRGPPSPSWIAGHYVDLLHNQKNVGDLEYTWARDYGATFKLKGTFGEEVLVISDAKAVQHVLHTSGYKYTKTPEMFSNAGAMTGHSMLNADALHHQRHRKLLNPAFAEIQLKTFTPLFQSASERLVENILKTVKSPGEVHDMHIWLGRATLDVIGEAGFGHSFRSIEDYENCEMAEILHHLLDYFDHMSAALRVLIWANARFPIIQKLSSLVPANKIHNTMKRYKDLSRKLGTNLILKNKDTLVMEVDPDGRDALSILVRSNNAQELSKQLTEDEVLSTVTAFIVAAQETTASTMAWMLFELSRNPDVQQAIREEILEARARYPDRRLTTKDYDDLSLLNAAFKESLRCHTVSPYVSRMASCDDVLPLAEPIVTTDGKTITSIPLKKGQSVEVAVHIYNRNPAVWGDDAHVWRPARFLEKTDKQVSLGLYSNLATFSGGVRGCIGWRFAVMEAQALATELIENFRFEPPEDLAIRRAPGLLMTAKIVGQKDHQPHMPLKVTPLVHA